MFGLTKDRESAIKELEIRNENLDLLIETLLKELKVTPEQLTKYLNNPENFTESNWNKIQELKKELLDQLSRDLTKKSAPKKNAITDPRWLFVK